MIRDDLLSTCSSVNRRVNNCPQLHSTSMDSTLPTAKSLKEHYQSSPRSPNLITGSESTDQILLTQPSPPFKSEHITNFSCLFRNDYTTVFKVTAGDKHFILKRSAYQKIKREAAIGLILNSYSSFPQTYGLHEYPVFYSMRGNWLQSDQNQPYLVQEFCPRDPWFLTERQQVEIFLQVLLNLYETAGIGFTHNDLHRDNILIQKHTSPVSIILAGINLSVTTTIKIIDFEYSRLLHNKKVIAVTRSESYISENYQPIRDLVTFLVQIKLSPLGEYLWSTFFSSPITDEIFPFWGYPPSDLTLDQVWKKLNQYPTVQEILTQ